MAEILSGAKEGGDIDNSENCEEKKPDDASSEDGSGGVFRPENRQCGVEWKKRKKEKFTITDTARMFPTKQHLRKGNNIKHHQPD